MWYRYKHAGKYIKQNNLSFFFNWKKGREKLKKLGKPSRGGTDSLIPALQKQRWGLCEFKASMNYEAFQESQGLKKKKEQKEKKKMDTLV